MRRPCTLICAALLAAFIFSSCAAPRNIRVNAAQSFAEATPVNDHYLRKAAIVFSPMAKTPFDRQAEALFWQTLIDEIRDNASRLQLVTPQDSQLPAYLKTPDLFSAPRDVFDVSQKARTDGYQDLMQAGLLSISSQAKQTGIWWFRKERYFMTVSVALDVYDTISAAKVYSRVKSNTVKIDRSDYEDYLAHRSYNIDEVDSAITGLAEELGKAADQALVQSRWMTSITAVNGNRVELAVDPAAGVQIGDKFAVFDARQIVAGPDGAQYVLPGYKLTDIHVSAVANGHVQASFEGPASLHAGDIAIAAH